MGKVICKALGLISTNCYFIVNEETNEMILVDPADSADYIVSVIEEKKYYPKAILLTHGHYDHILAVRSVKEKYDIPVIAGEKENKTLRDPSVNLSRFFGKECAFSADSYIEDEEVFETAGFIIKGLHTPGHTEGSMCYYFEKEGFVISGDTLFYESVGRTDFPKGSTLKLINSIKEKLFVLPDKTDVYPGHGEPTTIGHEKNYNPFCAETRKSI